MSSSERQEEHLPKSFYCTASFLPPALAPWFAPWLSGAPDRRIFARLCPFLLSNDSRLVSGCVPIAQKINFLENENVMSFAGDTTFLSGQLRVA